MSRSMKYRVFVVALGLMLALNTYAQQVPLYSQYMMNKFLLNPAVAGAEGYTAFSLTAREQWTGFPNSPKTHALAAQTRILRGSFISKSSSIKKKRRRSKRSGRVGVGGYLYNDQNGIIDRTGLQFTYAYHINIKNSQLSLGLSLNSYQFRIKGEDMILYEQQDQLLDGNKLTLFIPDASVGAYYSDVERYVGLSADNLVQSSLKLGNRLSSKHKTLRHYYLMGGHFFTIHRHYIIEPSLLFKMNELGNVQFEANSRLYYQEMYWGGLSYRTGAEGGSIILMGGVKMDKFFVGYAFDYTLSNLMRHTYGTHEFIAAVKFGDNARRYRWLNRY